MMLFPTTPGRPSEVSVSQKVVGYLMYLEVLFRTYNLLQCALPNLLSEYMSITDSTCTVTIFKKYSQIKAKTFILTKDKFCVSVSRSIATKPKKCCNIQMVIVYGLMRVTAKIDLCTQL